MLRLLILASILITCFPATNTWGQEGVPSRVALVIGNGDYANASLRNAVNDARAMSKRLVELGFQVISVENADRDAMQQGILDFASRLERDSTGLFYYAGHGIQSRGRNYLLPVDAQVGSERALKFEALNVQAILEEMEFAGNGINFVILDACRNNPFERRFRGGSRGLAAIDAARGTLIAYATAPGAVAADGEGDNGLYTEALLSALAVPGLKAEEVFKRVRVAVTSQTDGAQVPWESSSLTGDFVFNRPQSATAITTAAAAPAPATGSDREALFWETIKDSTNPADFRAYLQQYPEGTFAALAHIRVSALDEEARRGSGTAQGSAGAASAAPTAPAHRLKVALLPSEGWHRLGQAPLSKALGNMEKGTGAVVKKDPRLALVYAHDRNADGDSRVGDADRYWEGTVAYKTPKREEVLATGRALGADIVLTYFFKRSSNQVQVEAYLFDVRTGKSMKRDISGAPGGGYAKVLTKQLVNDLFAGTGSAGGDMARQ